MEQILPTSIGFASDLVPLVLNGSKTLTYRIGTKYDRWTAGMQVATYDSTNRKEFAILEILKKSNILFKDLSPDAEGHEVYSSKEEMRNVFNKYYGNVHDDDYVVVLEFNW